MARGWSPKMASGSETGALRGRGAAGETRMYGSTGRNAAGGQADTRVVEHTLRPGDTLQGLALRHGVSMEQIKRMNRLYTNDSIFLKETILIPVAGRQGPHHNGLGAPAEPERGPLDHSAEPPHPPPVTTEVSVTDFLRRLDSKISKCKEAAIRKLQEEEEETGSSGVQTTMAACSGPSTDRGTPVRTPPAQRAILGPVRLTQSSRAASLRDTEDEIFNL
ncbi:lysM and putative peptidoglycan-binding domain-containing protein 1-like [Callorhinchus milii]|uniref:lysM and putative peptidoglycan-binding domain-containing protein 1-like n=1 Tax=Callorhinchus milii TaxID=7868 RepID=UPI001C3FF583|nr:lysM and putative peptidoglycan-binding domain-containing protein 1-like [Callorhinchus milii]